MLANSEDVVNRDQIKEKDSSSPTSTSSHTKLLVTNDTKSDEFIWDEECPPAMKENLPSPAPKRLEAIRLPSPVTRSGVNSDCENPHNSHSQSQSQQQQHHRRTSPRRQSWNGVDSIGVKRPYRESPLSKASEDHDEHDEQHVRTTAPATPTTKLPLRRKNKISD